MSQKHTCPRRAEDGTDTADSPFRGAGPNKDTYVKGHGLVGQNRGCSYCGSMEPGDFLQALRDGATLDVTDKNYKAYIKDWAGTGPNGGKFYFQHFSVAQRHEFIDMLNRREVRFGWPGNFTVLPYFIKEAQ